MLFSIHFFDLDYFTSLEKPLKNILGLLGTLCHLLPIYGTVHNPSIVQVNKSVVFLASFFMGNEPFDKSKIFLNEVCHARVVTFLTSVWNRLLSLKWLSDTFNFLRKPPWDIFWLSSYCEPPWDISIFFSWKRDICIGYIEISNLGKWLLLACRV